MENKQYSKTLICKMMKNLLAVFKHILYRKYVYSFLECNVAFTNGCVTLIIVLIDFGNSRIE